MIEAFPLQWPAGYDRTRSPRRAAFKNTKFDATVRGIIHQLKLMHATLPVISTNIPIRKDGLPYATHGRIHDNGVAVYFVYDKQQMVLACDRWDRIEDNLRAIELTIESMRALDRWGVSDMLKRAFTGFTALPEQKKRSCWEVLGIAPTKDQSVIAAAYRTKAKESHPDMNGGSHSAFIELQEAMAEADKYCKE